MNQNLGVGQLALSDEMVDRRSCAVVSRATSRDDADDLARTARDNDLVRRRQPGLDADDQNVVDALGSLERCQCVLEDGQTAKTKKLLRVVKARTYT